MVDKIRYYTLPLPILKEQKINPLTRNLHLCETGEVVVSSGSEWILDEKSTDCLLFFCTKGEGSLIVNNEVIPFHERQFFILPSGNTFTYCADRQRNSRFLITWFNGENINYFEKEFMVVRDVIPSVKNQFANREMLFDELFNNLAKGFHDENLRYINFCFGHLLATFIYGYRTNETEEGEPGHMVRRAILYFEKNLHKKITLNQVAKESGYSPTYFSTIFRKETGYAPVSYFSHLKIVKACEYLDLTSYKVKQVSFLMGYTDPYYFTRDFKLKMGLSPRQYRNRTSASLIRRDQ